MVSLTWYFELSIILLYAHLIFYIEGDHIRYEQVSKSSGCADLQYT